jgi:hypothetical protein
LPGPPDSVPAASEDEDAIIELSLLASMPPQHGNFVEMDLDEMPPLLMPDSSCNNESSVGSSESYQPPASHPDDECNDEEDLQFTFGHHSNNEEAGETGGNDAAAASHSLVSAQQRLMSLKTTQQTMIMK